MAKEKKGFFKEFKEFITRGNVLDMAVGIIVGGAFTAIITALVSGILTPLLQMVGVGEDGFGALQVILRDAKIVEGVEVAPAVVLDFGIVISAIITFLLTALVLFIIVKIINTVRESAEEFKKQYEPLTKEEVKALRKEGKSSEEIHAAAAAKKAKQEAEAPAPAPTQEELLAQIVELLKAQKDGTPKA